MLFMLYITMHKNKNICTQHVASIGGEYNAHYSTEMVILRLPTLLVMLVAVKTEAKTCVL